MARRSPMTVNEKILSYLANRKGDAVAPSAIANGTRLRLGTVSTQLPKLIDRGHVIRVRHYIRAGRSAVVLGLVHGQFRDRWLGLIVERRKPLSYADLKHCADMLERAANALLTGDPDDDDRKRHELRIARDMYRDLCDRGVRPASRLTSERTNVG